MAVSDLVYTAGKLGILSDTINLATDVIQICLVGSGYTNAAADTFVDIAATTNDAAGQEISTSGYTPGFSGSGRKTLTSLSFVTSGTQAEFHCSNVTWTGLATGATIQGAIVYKRGTSDTDSKLIAAYALPATPTNGGDISISFASSGLILLT
jgi:hypothetical protein